MAVNKVVYNDENGPKTLIDLTDDSVTPETLAEGVTAHDASGNIIHGVGKRTSVLYTEQNLTDAQKAQARSNIGAQSTTDIPDYWQTALDNGVDDIRRAMEAAGRNKSSFFFYSDAHWSNETTYTAKLAPTLLKYLYKKTPINKTSFGGDIVSAESTDTDIMAYLWDWREQLRGLPNHHSVIGNHDDGNSTDRLLSKDYIYSYLLAPEESNDIVWGGDFYYYIDDKSENTRYLYLDIFYDRVSTAQQNFIKEAIKAIPENWHIIAICHAWFANDYSVYPPILKGLASEMQPFFDMFDNYNARTGEFADCGGKVELCIGGHYHLDHHDTTAGGIPVVIVEADTLHNRSGTMPQKGTIDESAISAVICDYNAKEIKVIRIGRGNSYAIDIESGESTVYYSITNNFTNVSSSSESSKVVANSAYSTTLTATVGTLVSVSVTMGGTDVTSTVYDAATGVINISAVTGDVVIIAVARQAEDPDASYTNVIKTSIDKDGNIFNSGKGWAGNSRIGSGGIYLGNGTHYVTGHIEIDPTIDNTFYLKNVTFDSATHNNYAYVVAYFDDNFARLSIATYSTDIAGNATLYAPVLEGTNIVQFRVRKSMFTNNNVTPKYIAICCSYLGDDSIITVNEPID
jgi:hypothetical protein